MNKNAVLILILIISSLSAEIVGGVHFGGSFETSAEYISKGENDTMRITESGVIAPYLVDIEGGYLFEKSLICVFINQQIGFESSSEQTCWNYFSTSSNLGVGKKIPFFYSSVYPYAAVGFLHESVNFPEVHDITVKLNTPQFKVGTDLLLPFIPIADISIGYQLRSNVGKESRAGVKADSAAFNQGVLQHGMKFGLIFHRNKKDTSIR